MSSNQITLPAGTYLVDATCPAYAVDNHKARLQNITDGQTLLVGMSHRSANGNSTQTQSLINGIIILTAEKTLELQHYCQTTLSTSGFGNPTSISGVNEVYSIIVINKVV